MELRSIRQLWTSPQVIADGSIAHRFNSVSDLPWSDYNLAAGTRLFIGRTDSFVRQGLPQFFSDTHSKPSCITLSSPVVRVSLVVILLNGLFSKAYAFGVWFDLRHGPIT